MSYKIKRYRVFELQSSLNLFKYFILYMDGEISKIINDGGFISLVESITERKYWRQQLRGKNLYIIFVWIN